MSLGSSGMHFISYRLDRRRGFARPGHDVLNISFESGCRDTPLFVDPLCGADPRSQVGDFRLAARITQRAQTVGTYSHLRLR